MYTAIPMTDERLFVATALILGLTFAFVNPPFQAPDEVLHFFRGEAIANGHWMPNGGGRPDSAPIPQGLKTLVWVMQQRSDFRMAYAIPLEPVKEPIVQFPAWYTPVPYLPQALAGAVTRLFNIRPLIGFYAGRVFNLLVAVGLITLGMRVAPQWKTILAAVALLPTTLFQFAAWSADALTIAAALLLIAMLLTENVPPLAFVIAAALVVALCKPAYFLIAAMVFVGTKSWTRIAAVIGATVVGTATSFVYARLAYYQQRGGMPIDPAAQLRCIISDPMRFAGILLHDFGSHGAAYFKQAIGRMGTDLNVPFVIIALEVALLLAVAFTSGIELTATRRSLALAVVLITAGGVVLSQYLNWSIVCSDVIEGVQGRYFLPVLPLALAALALPYSRWRVGMRGVVAVAIVSNAVAITTLTVN